MVEVRVRKVVRDLWIERGRVLLMTLAVAASLLAGMTVLGARAILTREMAANYLGTRPASATLELEGAVDAGLVDAVRTRPGVADAEARDMLLGRARVGDDWVSLLLFVVDDFRDVRLNTFRLLDGRTPEAPREVLLERTALGVLGVEPGGTLLVRTPHGAPVALEAVGTVHDPGLAPAWQERAGYAYVSRETLALLGEPATIDELRVLFDARETEAEAVEADAAALSGWLASTGHAVHEISVPPPRRHPHQTQMYTVLALLLVFTALTLVLASVVVASSLGAMLARQVREIGVLKAIGARSADVGALYAALVLGLSTAALAAALPLGTAGARAMAGSVAGLLNFELTDAAIPAWVYGTIAAVGVLVPLAVAAVPIGRASRVTVRAALDDHGVADAPLRAVVASLPPALRSVLRRPARLALTMGLLSAGGATFMSALNLSRAWDRNLEKIDETRFYDAEVRFLVPQGADVAEVVAAVPGVGRVERWGMAPTAFAEEDAVDVVRAYPDRRHGTLSILAPPADTPLVRFPLLAGRWLSPDDRDAVVLNHSAAAMRPGVRVGDRVLLSVDGTPTPWRVVGIVEEIGSAGVAYVTDAAFAAVAGTGERAAMLRVDAAADGPAERARVVREIERALDAYGAPIEAAMPLAELRTAVSEHMAILVRMLLGMAGVMATVGTVGLASALASGVVERTREIGVRKTLGATPGRIAAMFVAEAAYVSALSWPVAVLVSLPLTAVLDAEIGKLGFLAGLPFVIHWPAVPAWLVLTLGGGVLASLVPARQAAGISVRDALVHV